MSINTDKLLAVTRTSGLSLRAGAWRWDQSKTRRIDGGLV